MSTLCGDQDTDLSCHRPRCRRRAHSTSVCSSVGDRRSWIRGYRYPSIQCPDLHVSTYPRIPPHSGNFPIGIFDSLFIIFPMNISRWIRWIPWIHAGQRWFLGGYRRGYRRSVSTDSAATFGLPVTRHRDHVAVELVPQRQADIAASLISTRTALAVTDFVAECSAHLRHE